MWKLMSAIKCQDKQTETGGCKDEVDHLGQVWPQGILAVHCRLQPPSLTKVSKSLAALI